MIKVEDLQDRWDLSGCDLYDGSQIVDKLLTYNHLTYLLRRLRDEHPGLPYETPTCLPVVAVKKSRSRDKGRYWRNSFWPKFLLEGICDYYNTIWCRHDQCTYR